MTVPQRDSCPDAFRNPLLHIGYPKTGSTWLQRAVFRHPDSGCHAIPAFDLLEHFVFTDDAEYDPERVRTALAPHLTQAAANRRVPILSNEVLIGDQTQGRYWGHLVGRRMHAVFPKGRVLIVIREQTAMVVSSYRQHLKVGGSCSLRDFVARAPGFDAVCRLEFFAYDRMIGFFRDLFGSDQVLVLPYELLRSDAERYARRVLDFAGIPYRFDPGTVGHNAGYGVATLLARRHLNRLWGGWTYFDGPTPPRGWRRAEWVSRQLDRFLPTRWQERRKRALHETVNGLLRGQYAASNRRTEALIGVDLAQFGYRT